MEYRFDHENLDVYKLALEVARACVAMRIPTGRARVRDQRQRAADSAVLNIAEGRARGGDAGRNPRGPVVSRGIALRATPGTRATPDPRPNRSRLGSGGLCRP